MSDEKKVGSFDPDQHSEGGYFDDRDCTIVKAEVVSFDYQGKSDKPVCALHIRYRPDDAEDDDDERSEYYRIGDLDKFTPSPDKKFYIPVGTTQQMNKKSKGSLYLRALKEKGFELSKLSSGIDALEGLHVHVNIVPLPKIEGSDKENKILIVTKIHDKPAEGQKKAGGKKADSKKSDSKETKEVASPAAASNVDGAEDKATEVIVNLIMEKGGKVNKSNLASAMFSSIKDDSKLRNAAIALIGKTDWLSSSDRPWAYNGGELSIG